ncbi:hypothetical protein A2963_00325 [Candidatus Roizmanbacteria bacterium RIFCSPLOWO2_01_FULL_40_13]|nr:MAG: hypothetical protein A2963_00325 [Candidatus Roizmanbacteria bacterium RIFCSPLOWO2_01_FULL_40_13]
MRHIFFKPAVLFFLIATVFCLVSAPVSAQDFLTDYQIEYFLNEQDNKLQTNVKFTVNVTNLRSDVYVKQFAIGFPKSFSISNVKAYDDNGLLQPEVTADDGSKINIGLEFSQPNIGKNSLNNFYLEFLQDNLFNINGNVWEVIIPTIDRQKGNYKILVHLPENTDKKISIAKPQPDAVLANTVIWNNPTTKTVYAVFGDTQYYKSNLVYNLKNNKLLPVYTDIALPPDTLYQKIYLDSLDPLPEKVYSDSDGNYLARYYLNAREAKTVSFQGTIAVYSQLREAILPQIRQQFERQKNYLLAADPVWSVKQTKQISDLPGDPEAIYNFVIDRLAYDYNKVESENTRLGADKALANPDNAVCMEYTDLFVALARNKQINAREIEGYGFSQDPNFRPLSLVSDILHSWPEFYDVKAQVWQPIDPTWEDTSGIDYYSSFDLNHIAFVIHGQNPEYPLPAGTYKLGNSQDLTIAATNKFPPEKRQIQISSDPLPESLTRNKTYQSKINFTNSGNTYFWGNSIPVKSSNLEIQPALINLSPLAPLEKKTILLSYKVKNFAGQYRTGFNVSLADSKFEADFNLASDYLQITKTILVYFFIFLFAYFSLLTAKKLYRSMKK